MVDGDTDIQPFLSVDPPFIQDIYSGDGLVVDGATVIQPICLPPPGPVSWNQTNNGEYVQFSLLPYSL